MLWLVLMKGFNEYLRSVDPDGVYTKAMELGCRAFYKAGWVAHKQAANELDTVKRASKKDIQGIIDYFNEKAGKSVGMTPNREETIRARIKEGYVVDDFKKCVDYGVAEWTGEPTFEKFIRTETLFQSSEKMDKYIGLYRAPIETTCEASIEVEKKFKPSF